MKILIAEDDPQINRLLQEGFIEEGHNVQTAVNGDEALYLLDTFSYDVIVLDWMIPYKNGLELLQYIREKNITTPVLFLTAKDTINDKTLGFKSGADDYLCKPFVFAELLLRIEALHRRDTLKGMDLVHIKDIEINTQKKLVTKQNQIITLSSKEYELLLFLIKHKNSYVSKYMIEEELWHDKDFLSSNVIEVTIFNLRKKLSKELIKNFKGLGYKIED